MYNSDIVGAYESEGGIPISEVQQRIQIYIGQEMFEQ